MITIKWQLVSIPHNSFEHIGSGLMMISLNCFVFLATRNQQKLLDVANIAWMLPKILIQRNTRYDLLILKRKRVIERRFTIATEATEEIDATVDPMSPIVSSQPQPRGTQGRAILFLGKANRTGFRCIANRRKSTPPDASANSSKNEVINLFDAPISNADDDDFIYPIPFDDLNFGRMP